VSNTVAQTTSLFNKKPTPSQIGGLKTGKTKNFEADRSEFNQSHVMK
jgi:hypothetical protein